MGNCRVSQNHANKYMKLAKEKPEYLNYSSKSNLDISTAYALLSAPDDVKQDASKSVSQKIEQPINPNKTIV